MTKNEWTIEFRRNLRVQLRRKGWTKRDLANALDMSEVTIGRYVNGTRSPECYIVIQMAEAIGCSVSDLIGIL